MRDILDTIMMVIFVGFLIWLMIGFFRQTRKKDKDGSDS